MSAGEEYLRCEGCGVQLPVVSTPVGPCEDCGGELVVVQERRPCGVCGGKGWAGTGWPTAPRCYRCGGTGVEP